MENKPEPVISEQTADSSDSGFTLNHDVKQSINVSSMSIQSAYSGPLPTPEMMMGYGKLDPSFPERIMKMAESLCQAQVTVVNAEAEQYLADAEITRSEIVNMTSGQWIVASIIILAIIGITVIALCNHDSVAIALASSFGVIIAAMSFIVWRPHSVRK